MLIIFDLDDTLIETSMSITRVQMKKTLDFFLKEKKISGNLDEMFQDLCLIDSDAESAQDAIEFFWKKKGFDANSLSQAIEKIYGPLDPDVEVKAVEHVVEVLSNLSRHTLCLVSRGKRSQQLYKLEKAGIDSSVFCKIIVSEEKNKLTHYQALLEEYKVDPSNVVVCGDRVSLDLAPAKQIGCRTVQICKGRGRHAVPHLDVDFTIVELKEIEEIIFKLEKI